MISTFIILFACIESDYVDSKFIQNWALTVISNTSNPDVWLIELMDVDSSEQALEIIRKQLYDRKLIFNEKYDQLLIGFFYLRFLNKDISINELEGYLVDIVDNSNIEELDLEFVQDAFHQVTKIKVQKKQTLFNLLSEYGENSKECYNYLFRLKCIEEERVIFDIE